MTPTNPVSPLDWSVGVVDIPAGGLAWRMDADASACETVRAALEVRAVNMLNARGRIEARAGGSYRFSGEVTAKLVQACVVSLEDVAATVREPFVVDFLPAGQIAQDDGTVDFEAEADVEPIERGRLAVGRVVYETLAAGLDPYPRASGSELDTTRAAPAGSELNPFAVLKSLTGRKDP